MRSRGWNKHNLTLLVVVHGSTKQDAKWAPTTRGMARTLGTTSKIHPGRIFGARIHGKQIDVSADTQPAVRGCRITGTLKPWPFGVSELRSFSASELWCFGVSLLGVSVFRRFAAPNPLDIDPKPQGHLYAVVLEPLALALALGSSGQPPDLSASNLRPPGLRPPGPPDVLLDRVPLPRQAPHCLHSLDGWVMFHLLICDAHTRIS
ncbi:hypothetical protein GGX14DRAFT_388002 [Mycena pura]|uniref:Uncharacterized protein n=1 Tax=Mycena pura TaxID=153505 RepID=A0AAD6VT88_9AGAR|nr:hypothetical protein GGX14DRAFT_388002 [Mycena pura]